MLVKNISASNSTYYPYSLIPHSFHSLPYHLRAVAHDRNPVESPKLVILNPSGS
jgi:hypothetical protein